MEKVLLIEDEKKARETLAKVIKREGFEIFAAQNGKEGLDVFKKEKPDIVVTDIKMPEISGLEVLRTVKEISPESEVILISGHGDYDTAVTAVNYGATDYLKKPIDLRELIVALRECQKKIRERKNTVLPVTILIMEDEDKAREKLARAIRTQKAWNVLTACDGEEGMKLLDQQKVDIAIVDLKMPKKDGLTVLHEMKKMRNVCDCEVIIMTGYGDESAATKALREGAVSFQRKPVDIENLILSVEKALDKLNTQRALLYKAREADHAWEFIAKISAKKEIEIDLREINKKEGMDFFLSFTDVFELSLCVVDREMNVLVSNSRLDKVMKEPPTKADESFFEKMKTIGVSELDPDKFKEITTGLIESAQGSIKTISTGKYSRVFFSRISLLTDEGIKIGVLFMIRGER